MFKENHARFKEELKNLQENLEKNLANLTGNLEKGEVDVKKSIPVIIKNFAENLEENLAKLGDLEKLEENRENIQENLVNLKENLNKGEVDGRKSIIEKINFYFDNLEENLANLKGYLEKYKLHLRKSISDTIIETTLSGLVGEKESAYSFKPRGIDNLIGLAPNAKLYDLLMMDADYMKLFLNKYKLILINKHRSKN
jgi:DNA repair exonuclease SbcCD ATPase subunit